MGKMILILLLGTIVIFGVLNININNGLNLATDKSLELYAAAGARNVANSAVQLLIARLGDNNAYRVNSPAETDLLGGNAEYTVIDDIIGTDTLVKINVQGTYMGANSNISAHVKFPDGGSPVFPAAVLAAITTNNPVQTLGKLIVDGRDHDLNGNLLPGKGTLGIWTTNSYSRGGASTVGGTYEKKDYAPSKKYSSDIVSSNQTWPDGYPSTPEGILGGSDKGYPEGKLKSIAMSGSDGSQYVTDPSMLTYPLKGITYVELGNDETWQSMNIEGSGILIVHNKELNAKMKNLNTGTFKGLLVADDIVHIHAEIIGAVASLTPNPSEGNCIGNGDGSVLFSSEAIMSAMPSGGTDPILGFGFGKHRVELFDWYE
jgi:hypothetical protein